MPSNYWDNRYKRDGYTIFRSIGFPDETYLTGYDRTVTNFVQFGPNIPDWSTKLALGQDVTTGMVGRRYSLMKWKTVQYLVDSPVNGYSFTCSGYAIGYLDFLSGVFTPTTKALADAETNFAKSYRSITRQFNGGVFIAEIAETAALIRSPLKSLYGLTRTLTRDLRAIKRLRAKEYQARLADIWLAYTFGAKPLASDLNDYAKALRALGSGRNFDVKRIIGTAQDKTTEGPFVSTVGFTGAANYCEATADVIYSSQVTIRGAIKIAVNDGGELPVMMRFGLSKLDIVPAIWEGIPWSFLVDYFTNTGEVLDALMLRFVDFTWLNQTVRNSSDVIGSAWRCDPVHEGGTVNAIVKGGETHFSTKSVTRGVRSNDFGGSFYFKVPGQESLKWLNIQALISSIGASRPH